MKEEQKNSVPIMMVLLVIFILIGVGHYIYLKIWPVENKPVVINSNQPVLENNNIESKALLGEGEAGFKTYASRELGVEFAYPLPPTGCENLCNISATNSEFSVGRTNFFAENIGELSLNAFIDEKMKDYEITNRESKIIGGEEGIVVEYRFGGRGGFGEAAFLQKDKIIFMFDFTAGSFCCNKGEAIYEDVVFESMLSTFKFTK